MPTRPIRVRSVSSSRSTCTADSLGEQKLSDLSFIAQTHCALRYQTVTNYPLSSAVPNAAVIEVEGDCTKLKTTVNVWQDENSQTWHRYELRQYGVLGFSELDHCNAFRL